MIATCSKLGAEENKMKRRIGDYLANELFAFVVGIGIWAIIITSSILLDGLSHLIVSLFAMLVYPTYVYVLLKPYAEEKKVKRIEKGVEGTNQK